MSRPSSSSAGVTLTPPGQIQSCTFQIMNVIPNDHAAAALAPTPATAPEQAPTALVFPVCAQLRNIHHIAATAVAMFVFWKASVSKKPANPALPGLKPNHPYQSNVVPNRTSGIECGSKGALP